MIRRYENNAARNGKRSLLSYYHGVGVGRRERGMGWRIILEIVSRQLCGAGNPAGPCRNFPSNTDIVDRLRYVGTITEYYLFRLIRRGGSKVSMEIRINNTMVAR